MTQRKYREALSAIAAGIFTSLAAISNSNADAAADVTDVIQRSGIRGGLIVHIGCGSGEMSAALRARGGFIVHGLDRDAGRIQATRSRLRARGDYGAVSVDHWNGANLPYANDFVNLIVAEQAAPSDEEMMRVLAPRGVALIRTEDGWRRIEKPWPDDIDQWTHYLHGPDGNPVAKDARVAPPECLQWVGGPRWARHHDHMASMTSLVSSHGRLFYIMDEGPTASIQLPPRWMLIARDGFNGAILWKRAIPVWTTHQYPLKSGPAHLLRRLVAVGDRVFVTLALDEPVSVLDAPSGRTLMTLNGTDFTREIVVAGETALVVADTGPSKFPEWKREDTYVWDNTRRANQGWGWNGESRRILAVDTISGEVRWRVERPVAPCSLVSDGKRTVFHDGARLVCVDQASGGISWEADAAMPKSLVETSTGPRTLIYGETLLFSANNGRVSGWRLADGKKLWEQKQKPSGHSSLRDLFVVGGLAWTADIGAASGPGIFSGYDPATGETRREFPPDVDLHWFHHRCYPSKAAGKYLLTGRNGTEYVDIEARHWDANHWVRGGCIYGVLPCNGLTYAPMNACGCQLEAKVVGFNALRGGPPARPDPAMLSGGSRLEKGPGFGRGGDERGASDEDWPTYRHDIGRSGATGSPVPARLAESWRVRIGGRLSAPTIAGGKVFVASIDAHALDALDAVTGKRSWSFIAGGRIDSPPTLHRGLVLFGSADGYIYALCAEDGSLAWRFRGAPMDRRLMAWEQIESVWPVHGSVLVNDGVLYATAGRNMFLDGGVRFLRLNAMTGELLGETVMDDKDPVSGKDMHEAYLKRTPGNNMPVAHTDVLSFDGRYLWMRSQKIDLEGRRHEMGVVPTTEQDPEGFHLFSQNGFLDDTYFFRSYWIYGRRVGGGYGDWFKAGRLVPSGNIMCYDDRAVYGFGRKMEYMANASVIEYGLFSADKQVTSEAIKRHGEAMREINSRSNKRNADSSDWRLLSFFSREKLSAAKFQWWVDQPSILARAMTVAADTVFVAGPPDCIDEREAFHQPDDPSVQSRLRKQAEALEGAHGGELWAMAKSDGRVLARYAMNAIPVFDGMAAAGGRLFMCASDGQVFCMSGEGASPLPTADDRPIKVSWSQPEDSGYLRPEAESKAAEFAVLKDCSALSSDLGYRLIGESKKIGVALKRLDKPLEGAFVLRAHIASVEQRKGLLRNGHIAFGQGAAEAGLVKCGAGYVTRKATITQGPMKGGKAASANVGEIGDKGFDAVIEVDLPANSVRYTAAGKTVEAKLDRPIASVDHVGYVVNGAVMDFSPIRIERR